MKKMILTIGCPGSGKSTWAQNQAKDQQGVIVLNRDDMRQMIAGGNYRYSKDKDDLILNTLLHQAGEAFSKESIHTVIVADTNLSYKTRNKWKEVAEAHNATIEHKVFEVDLRILLTRNLYRGSKAVPEAVIRSMYENMLVYLNTNKKYSPNESLPKAVIFDIDGTLANNDHRKPYEYNKCIDDKLIKPVADTLKMYYNNGYKIILLSGRNAGHKDDHYAYMNLTEEWIDKYNIPCHTLVMRDWDDYRSDDLVKQELFFKEVAHRANVQCVYDDRDTVVAMWRRIGLQCYQVNYGTF